MIHSLCTRYSPSELELFLLDFKDGLTFKPYASFADSTWLPHARMLGLESDRDVGLAVLKDLESERRRRAVMFGDSSAGVHDFESYRKLNPDKQLPRIVLIIDEYQKLFDINDEISDEAASLLENLVRQGRACAIHIILASQSITGAAGLLGKDERIERQKKVREEAAKKAAMAAAQAENEKRKAEEAARAEKERAEALVESLKRKYRGY